MKNNIFGERLSEERKNNGISQSQLGNALKMTQRKISRMETGSADPTPDDIVEISNYFNTSTDYLLGITNNYNQKPEKGRKANNQKEKNIVVIKQPTKITNKNTIEKQTILIDYHQNKEDLKQEYWVEEDIINQILEHNINSDTCNIIKILNTYTAQNGKTLLENLIDEIATM